MSDLWLKLLLYKDILLFFNDLWHTNTQAFQNCTKWQTDNWSSLNVKKTNIHSHKGTTSAFL